MRLWESNNMQMTDTMIKGAYFSRKTSSRLITEYLKWSHQAMILNAINTSPSKTLA